MTIEGSCGVFVGNPARARWKDVEAGMRAGRHIFNATNDIPKNWN